MSTKSFQINSLPLRLLPVLGILVSLFFVYTGIKWSFGNTIAKLSDSEELSEFAASLAPNDAQAYFSLAVMNEKSFTPESFKKALENYEKAVSLSPNDFRLWLALGKARERNGDSAEAEKAIRRALELAPNYAEVHWVLGNQLLRQGNSEEAFLEIRKAVEQDNRYANPAVVTAWQIFAGDVTRISQKIGDSLPIKAGLVPLLAKQNQLDDAFVFWNGIPTDEKTGTYKAIGDEFITQLTAGKKFHNALIVQNDVLSSEDGKAAIGSIFNGSFEKDVKPTNADYFDWKIAAGDQPQITLDGSQKHAGSRSLIFLFNSGTGKDLRTIQQTVAVESGRSYKLEAFARAELKILGSIKIEILDANDLKVIGSTQDITTSAEWNPLTADFTVPLNSQAIIIRLSGVSVQTIYLPDLRKNLA